MRKEELSEALDEIAVHLEVARGEAANAYRLAADVVRRVDAIPPDPKELDGIGDTLRSEIIEFRTTGRITRLEELREEFPYVNNLTKVDGVGPARAKTIHDELGISTIDELEEAVESGDILDVHGIGEARAEKIERNIDRLK